MSMDRELIREAALASRRDPYAVVADANAVLELLDALDKAEAERDWNLRSSRRAKEQRIKANTRADQAEARIKAVRDVHQAVGLTEHTGPRIYPSGAPIPDDTPVCAHCTNPDGLGWVDYPCPTIRALDGDGDPGQPCGRGPCALGYGHPGACRC